jgi:APA family basic amino acid/polyamine antiporter
MASVVQDCFERKPIAALVAESEGTLKRVLGVRDLIALSIGAVIGAGIFGSIGTATAGQLDAAGHVIRSGAGPAVIFSLIR